MLDFAKMSGENFLKKIINIIKSHLEQLHLQLREYFPVTDDSVMWKRNPFADGMSTNLSLTLQE